MKELFDYQFDLVLKEIEVLHSGIRNFDSTFIKIKSWAITTFSAFIFFSIRESKPVFFLIAAIVILLFWIVEAQHKRFQRQYIVRYNQIEHQLRANLPTLISSKDFNSLTTVPDVKGFNTYSKLGKEETYKKLTGLSRAAFYWHTSLLYVAMLILLTIITLIELF